ncbi:Uncharacterised protein [Mycobacteroides abscessus subsp. abscessus]|nr:Uncharacterised protein [Mycobacteroides abscessus subsp. abscessus]SLC30481.1 Uncharacterised protein [Mycobacteroides abscessus subsp. massiliense]SHX37223.1 Uncharacterised protein [Mycobacteroides abscessus subsp. abscessus]SIA58686.1 Uncharacterised protein [Mycobacteroides abscessus subsp. abscessus]SIA66272.1 Uncharacterised protein [Mycobacteroides abscessus subsp. abscessus]
MYRFNTTAAINGHSDVSVLIFSFTALSFDTPENLALLITEARHITLRAARPVRLVTPNWLKNRIHQSLPWIISASGTSLEYISMTMPLFFQFK